MNEKNLKHKPAAHKSMRGTAAKRRRTRARRRPRVILSRADRFTLLWLVLFFPIGLTRMWQNKCRWKVGVKYAVSGLFAAFAVAILVLPSPSQQKIGSIDIVADDPEVEIYGPSAPSTMVNGYSSTQQETVMAEEAEDDGSNVTVYASEDGRCYHLGDCKFAYASAKRLTVYEAYFLGYKPCGNCDPPVYDPVTGQVTANTAAETSTATDTEEASAETGESVIADPTAEADYDDGSPDDIV